MSTFHLFLAKIVFIVDALLGALLAFLFMGEDRYQRQGRIPSEGPITAVQYMRLHREGLKDAD